MNHLGDTIVGQTKVQDDADIFEIAHQWDNISDLRDSIHGQADISKVAAQSADLTDQFSAYFNEVLDHILSTLSANRGILYRSKYVLCSSPHQKNSIPSYSKVFLIHDVP